MVKPQSAGVNLAYVNAWEDVEQSSEYEKPEELTVKDEWRKRRPPIKRRPSIVAREQAYGEDSS